MVEYKYNLLDEAWDIHWLKPRIYYEIGLLPNHILLAYPEVSIGFETELTPNQKLQLDNIMANKPDLGIEPVYKYKISTTIDPIAIQKVIGKKVLYHCVEGKVDLLFLDDLTTTEKSNLKKALANMWI